MPRGKRIGWVKEDGSILLEPGAAFAVAQDVARRQGSSLPINKRTLWKRMAEKGLLASRDAARGRNTTRATINKNRTEVVHLIPGVLSSDGPNGPNDPNGPPTALTALTALRPIQRALPGRKMGPFLRQLHQKRPARTALTPQKTVLRGRKGR